MVLEDLVPVSTQLGVSHVLNAIFLSVAFESVFGFRR